MIPHGLIGTAQFTVVSDETVRDPDLHKLGAVAQADMKIPGGALAGVGPNDYVPYRITATLGRRRQHKVTGPDGNSSGEGLNQLVGYELDVPRRTPNPLPGGQSPPTVLSVPTFVLPAPTAGGNNNLTITVTGAVEKQGGLRVRQTERISLYDEDQGVFVRDDLLDTIGATASIPQGAWNGLLIEYSGTAFLFIDQNGNVAGRLRSSGENPAQVYQYQRDTRIRSSTINVP